jgi:flagellar protein FliO/FliZ
MASAIRFCSAFLALAWVPLTGALYAQEASVTTGGTVAVQLQNQATTLSNGSGISLLGYIILILVLAVATVTVLFKGGFLGVLTGSPKANRKLNIEESRSLGHRQYLVVASYEGRKFLLGVCPGSIEYLSGLDSDETPAGSFQEILPSDSEPRADGVGSNLDVK